MSIRSFAEAAGTSPRRVRRLIRQGRLQSSANQAGEVRIPESELERVLCWKKDRALRQSMELQAIPEGEPEEQALQLLESGPVVPLPRHEAAMVRLGFLESELATTRRLLENVCQREEELKEELRISEKETISATVRAVEAEHNLEELRTQVIDSTFRSMELQDELKQLQDRLMEPWYLRIFRALRGEKSD